jgi:hypothetical protein
MPKPEPNTPLGDVGGGRTSVTNIVRQSGRFARTPGGSFLMSEACSGERSYVGLGGGETGRGRGSHSSTGGCARGGAGHHAHPVRPIQPALPSRPS